jgi:mannose-1-phosphate guanylyltransferase
MKALLLSAGLGTRLRPFTNQLPKPCIPFFGIPLSWYSLYLLHETQCRDVVVNLHYLPKKVQNLFDQFPVKDFSFQYSLEKDRPMGSGGALFYAKNLLAGSNSFFAMNSDEVFIPSNRDILLNLQTHHEKTKSLATLLVTDHPELGKSLKPVWIDKEGVVQAFGEKPNHPNVRPVHYTGCKIFSKDVLPLLPTGESHIFHDTLVPAMSKGALVNTLFDSCQWWETGNFASFMKATGDVIDIVHANPKSNYIRDVYSFVGKHFLFSTHIDGSKIARHESAHGNPVHCQGVVFIDRGVSLKENITLNNTLVNEGTVVNTSLSDTMIFAEDQ